MADAPFQFGTRVADDYQPSDEGTQWIRGFPAGSTQIRLVPCESTNARGVTVYGYQAWTSEREHFDPELQVSYPCTEDYGIPEPEGVGCRSSSARVRERNRKYYVNALNKDFELKVYKFGPVVWKAFKRRQDRMVADNPDNPQPLSDRDYIVHKSGSGKQGTEYEVENGEVYEVDFPDEVHDIPAALQAQWDEAIAKYTSDEPTGHGDGDEDVHPPAKPGRIGPMSRKVEPDEPRPAAKKAAPAAKKAAPAAKKAAPAAKKAESNGGGDGVTLEQLDDYELPELREWVEGEVPKDYELPERATRGQLMKIARAVLAGDMPPF